MSKVAGRKKRIIITTAALVAVGGGAAFAYWSATGMGDGTAQAGDTTDFTISSTVTAGGPLSPNGPIQTVTFTVTNPGSGVQKVTAVTAAVADTEGIAWDSGTCSAADFAVGTPVFTAKEVAPGGTATGTVTLQMINRVGVDQNGCKGATVPLHFAAS